MLSRSTNFQDPATASDTWHPNNFMLSRTVICRNLLSQDVHSVFSSHVLKLSVLKSSLPPIAPLHRRFTMSLRRSARISTTTAPTVPEPAAYKKATPKPSAKPTTVTKKRKSRASNTTTLPPKLSKEEAAESIFAPDAQPVFAVPELPSTPLPKRRKAASESPSKPPPFTPTPSAVGLLAHTHPAGEDHPLESPGNLKPRPAEPHATNAPLSTPGGSRVTAFTSSPAKPSTPLAPQDAPGASPAKKSRAKETVPPDVGVLNKPTATIDTLLKDAEEFLCKVDPKLKPLVEKHKCKVFSPEGLREVVDPFTALSSGIIGQQVCAYDVDVECNSCRCWYANILQTGVRTSRCLNTQEVHRL